MNYMDKDKDKIELLKINNFLNSLFYQPVFKQFMDYDVKILSLKNIINPMYVQTTAGQEIIALQEVKFANDIFIFFNTEKDQLGRCARN